ncbi:MAG: hypothetical protein ACK5NT_02240 [Pyrinomonadaceae bacterium]
MNIELTEKRKELDSLSQRVNQAPIPKAEYWGGADVCIVSQKPESKGGGFYPDPRYVVTEHAAQLSWLFIQLKSIFIGLIDGISKIEFYGRLANAALRYQDKNEGNENQKDLLFAVLREAYGMLDEMEEGEFENLTFVVGNSIANDSIEPAEGRGYISVDETRKFFAERGLEI